MKGQPLWFLGAAVGGWIAVRAIMLWPVSAPLIEPIEALVPRAAAVPRTSKAQPLARTTTTPIVTQRATGTRRFIVPPALSALPRATAAPDAAPVTFALSAPSQVTGGIPLAGQADPVTRASSPLGHPPARLSGSAWAIVRGGGAIPFASQLGGSQAGMRLTYAVDRARRLALAGRFASALRSRQQEAALGLDWRPTDLPIHLIAEQRLGIANARGGPALGLIGGVGPVPLTGTLRIDAYAQGGAIARNGVEGFVDGAARLSQSVAALGPTRLELGLAAWGGAQRGAARLDVGPAVALALPLATRTMRVSLEWRQRVAGSASPSSGPALAIGTDF